MATDAKVKTTAAVDSVKQATPTQEKTAEPAKKETAKEAKPAAAASAVKKSAQKSVKAPAKAKAAAKPAVKKAAKAVGDVKKIDVKKSDVKSGAVAANVVLQFSGKSYSLENLIASVKDVWVYDLGKEIKDFKSVDLYVKTEESRVYAVVNGLEQLDFAI